MTDGSTYLRTQKSTEIASLFKNYLYLYVSLVFHFPDNIWPIYMYILSMFLLHDEGFDNFRESARGLEGKVSHTWFFRVVLKKPPKPGSKVRSRDPGVMIVLWLYMSVLLYFFVTFRNICTELNYWWKCQTHPY